MHKDRQCLGIGGPQPTLLTMLKDRLCIEIGKFNYNLITTRGEGEGGVPNTLPILKNR